ncbi:hypothetical protein FACS1894122_15440 [Alphaproteobacteria bacterium]|nr:hypothetical protein FACS1894122_15440 [Alphaproteobacteria bacterium]
MGVGFQQVREETFCFGYGGGVCQGWILLKECESYRVEEHERLFTRVDEFQDAILFDPSKPMSKKKAEKSATYAAPTFEALPEDKRRLEILEKHVSTPSSCVPDAFEHVQFDPETNSFSFFYLDGTPALKLNAQSGKDNNERFQLLLSRCWKEALSANSASS